MVIRSSTALRNEYDSMVQLSKDKGEPIFITRNGEGEMVFLPIDLWEQRQSEFELLEELLRRERNMLAGAKTFTMTEMEAIAEGIVHGN